MASRYSIAKARANLAKIIDQAAAGETVELTRRGRPVAVVLSCEALERLRSGRPRFGEAYRAFLERFPIAEAGIDDEVFAIARDRSPGR